MRFLRSHLTPLRVTLVALVLVFSASLVLAQAAPEAPVAPSISTTLASAITAVGAIALPWITYFVAIVLFRGYIPRLVLPFIPIALSFVVEKLPEWLAGVQGEIGVAAIALIGLVLREVLTSFTQHGLAGGGAAAPGIAPGVTRVLFSK